MLGVVWLGFCIVAAWIWLLGSPALAHHLTALELLTAACIVGVCAGGWIVYFIASLLSMMETQTFILFFVFVAACIAERAANSRRALQRLGEHTAHVIRRGVAAFFTDASTRDDAVILSLLAVVALPAYMLFSSRMLPEKDGTLWSGGSCWADLPIHMHIVESFLSGRNTDVSFTDMHSPIFAGENMYYPFMPDFHAAVMVKLGASVRTSFLVPGVLLFLAFLSILYALALRVTKSRTAAVMSLALVVLCGGMGGISWLREAGWAKAVDVDTAQGDPTGHNRVWWFAFLPHIFLPQRGATFAYPLALLVLLLVWRASDAAMAMPASERRGLLLHAAGFAGMLPFIQAPSFLGAGIVIAVIFLLDAHKWLADLRLLWSWILAGALAAALGLPQIAYFRKHLAQAHGGNFVSYGWLHLRTDNQFTTPPSLPWTAMPFGIGDFLRFWCNNLGAAVPLFFLALIIIVVDVVIAALKRAPVAAAPAGEAAGVRSEHVSKRLLEDGDEHSSLLVHFWFVALSELPVPLANILSGRTPLDSNLLDSMLAPLNSNSSTGRALDAAKLGLGAAIIFVLGNYVMFQPWDRDNTKILYIWTFLASILSAGALAAPVDALLDAATPGPAFIATILGSPAGAKQASGRVKGVSLVLVLALPVIFFLNCFTGVAMLVREWNHNYQLFDRDQINVGTWMKQNIPPKAVVLHRDDHIIASGSIAGRPALIGYTGWVDSHGYNYRERQADREYVLANCLKESDQRAYQGMRRWGVRYVLGENLPVHERPRVQEYERAKAAAAVDPSVPVPNVDPYLFLDGQLRQIYSVGRFQVLEVLGYSNVPGT